MTLREEALHMHRLNQGKLETVSKVPVRNAVDLSLAYSPGVAEPCKDIYDKPDTVYDYTMKGILLLLFLMERLYWDLETSVRKAPCRLWKVKPFYLKVSLEWTLSQSV